jgi:hypothetical protein
MRCNETAALLRRAYAHLAPKAGNIGMHSPFADT